MSPLMRRLLAEAAEERTRRWYTYTVGLGGRAKRVHDREQQLMAWSRPSS